MPFDALTFLQTYGVDHTDRGKHGRTGWVQIECPWCVGKQGYYGGFNLSKGYFVCWRCKWHPLADTLALLLNITRRQARDLITKYQTHAGDYQGREDEEFVPAQKCKLPGGDLQEPHRQYLIKRGFDPEDISITWRIRGTDHKGPWKWRIVAPIHLDGRLVSFQTRDITNKQVLRYKACPKDNEVTQHQHTLYGIDLATSDKVLVVEGIFDAWRIGPGCVATFGSSWTMPQVKMLCRFEEIGIVYDPEEEAQIQAERLAFLLEGLGKRVSLYDIDAADPAEMSEEEVDQLRDDFFG